MRLFLSKFLCAVSVSIAMTMHGCHLNHKKKLPLQGFSRPLNEFPGLLITAQNHYCHFIQRRMYWLRASVQKLVGILYTTLQLVFKKYRPSFVCVRNSFNQPTIAQRCRSETDENILEDLFSSVLSQFKKHQPSGNLKFNNVSIFRNFKLLILMGKKSFQFLLSYDSKDFGLYMFIK